VPVKEFLRIYYSVVKKYLDELDGAPEEKLPL
jgi:hypothetical protein